MNYAYIRNNHFELFILLIIATVPFGIERKISGVWITSSDLLIAATIIAAAVRMLWKKYRPRVTDFPFLFIISGLLTTFIISAFGAFSQFEAIKETCKFALLFGYFFLLTTTVKSEETIKKIPYIIFLSTCILSVWFIFDFFYRQMPIYHDKIWHRFPFSEIHFNALASYICAGIPFGFYIFSRINKQTLKITIMLAITVHITALLFTYSRINWIIMAATMIIVLFIKYRLKGILLSGIILACPFVLAIQYNPNLELKERLLSITNINDVSRNERIELINNAIVLIKKRPLLGVGLGNYSIAVRQYLNSKVEEMSHMIYLQFWAEAGIFTLLLFISILIKYYIDACTLARRLNAQVQERSLLLYSTLSFSIIILANQFGDPFIRTIKELFMLLLSFPYLLLNMQRNRESTD